MNKSVFIYFCMHFTNFMIFIITSKYVLAGRPIKIHGNTGAKPLAVTSFINFDSSK